MITPSEIQRSLTGAWRIFLGHPDAMRFFDTSTDGFWRSFQAIVLVAPIYAVTALADWRAMASNFLPDEGGVGAEAFVAVKMVTLALDWVALPVLLAALAGFLGIRRAYTAFIVARNWSTVLVILPFAAIALLDIAGLMNESLILFPSLAALGFALRFGYMVARTALGVGIEVAIGVVALDFLVSLAIVRIVGRLTGVEG